VTGASPIVDVQNVRSQNQLTQETLTAIPTGKTFQGFGSLTVGVVIASANQDVGGDKGEKNTYLAVHGGNPNDQRMLIDGMRYNLSFAQGSSRWYMVNQNQVAEVVLETGGTGADTETGGVQLNTILKDGGNQFTGTVSGNYVPSGFQGNNLDDDLRGRGVSSATKIRKIYDIGGGFGGPIKRDKLWFYGSARRWGSQQFVPGNYFNATPGTLFYTPDLSRQAYQDIFNRDVSGRVTWQAAAKHKFTFFSAEQRNCLCFFQVEVNRSPEAAADESYGPVSLTQVTWNSPFSNKILLQAGFTNMINRASRDRTFDRIGPSTISVTEQTTGYIYGAPSGPGGRNYAKEKYDHQNGRMAASYVTGSHSAKVGFEFTNGINEWDGTDYNQSPVSYAFRGGVPVQVSYFTTPVYSLAKFFQYGLYAQDQWTLSRFTFTPGIRFDNFHAWVPAQTKPAGPLVGEVSFAKVDNVPLWRNFTPRMGVAWDVQGNGKTAVKAFIGRFLSQEATVISSALAGTNVLSNSATRTWTDSNSDFVPDAGELGPLSNSRFGTPVINTQYSNDLLTGDRPYQWQTLLSFQHELSGGIGISGGYFRTWYGNFRATANTAVSPGDYSPYCVTAPSDARLPGGGGNQVCGFFDVNPNAVGRENNLIQAADTFGKVTQTYNGFDITVNARFGKGGRLAGGLNTGETNSNVCYANNLPNVLATDAGTGSGGPNPYTPSASLQRSRTSAFCDTTLPFKGQTQIKLNGSYPLPYDLQLSAVFQNLAGVPILGTYAAPNAAIAPSLGRNLSSCGAAVTCAATVALTIVEPYKEFEDRLTQVDLRLTKKIKLGKSNLLAMFDLYNVANANTVLVRNNTFGPTYGLPTSYLGARLFKISGQWDF
jgi:hypothetical protein